MAEYQKIIENSDQKELGDKKITPACKKEKERIAGEFNCPKQQKENANRLKGNKNDAGGCVVSQTTTNESYDNKHPTSILDPQLLEEHLVSSEESHKKIIPACAKDEEGVSGESNRPKQQKDNANRLKGNKDDAG
eukprot:8117085-Ditylum_brightwellii.AAC.1